MRKTGVAPSRNALESGAEIPPLLRGWPTRRAPRPPPHAPPEPRMSAGVPRLSPREDRPMAQATTPLLVTHSGTFHADDALAYAVLRAAVFVTLQRFVGAARSRAGALALAHQALALGDDIARAPLG